MACENIKPDEALRGIMHILDEGIALNTCYLDIAKTFVNINFGFYCKIWCIASNIMCISKPHASSNITSAIVLADK